MLRSKYVYEWMNEWMRRSVKTQRSYIILTIFNSHVCRTDRFESRRVLTSEQVCIPQSFSMNELTEDNQSGWATKNSWKYLPEDVESPEYEVPNKGGELENGKKSPLKVFLLSAEESWVLERGWGKLSSIPVLHH